MLDSYNDYLLYLNSIGLWSIIQLIVIISGAVFGFLVFTFRRSHIQDLNFYITWERNGGGKYPLILRFEVRNLSSNFIAISSPYFIFKKMKAGKFAHGDTSSGRYEVKFRKNNLDKVSEVACLLRHRDTVTSYIPLDETQSDSDLMVLSANESMGNLYCDVIFLTDKPKVRKLKIPLRNVSRYSGAEYYGR